MIPDKVIYTDGRDVTVTESTLKVKNTSYLIKGITKFSLWTIHPDRWPGILLLVLGALVAVCGWLGMAPPDWNLRTDNGLISGDSLLLWSGIGLAIIGLIILALTRERYAVRIATAEGEKNAVVSGKKAYIQQIVDALNRAFNYDTTATQTYTSDPQGRVVIR